MIILAKSVKGQEFLYSYQSAHRVAKTRADEICKALNNLGYQLNEGEVWHKHEVDSYDSASVFAENQKFRIYRGRLQDLRG